MQLTNGGGPKAYRARTNSCLWGKVAGRLGLLEAERMAGPLCLVHLKWIISSQAVSGHKNRAQKLQQFEVTCMSWDPATGYCGWLNTRHKGDNRSGLTKFGMNGFSFKTLSEALANLLTYPCSLEAAFPGSINAKAARISPKVCRLPIKLTPGCPGLPSAPPDLKFSMQAKHKVLGSPAVSVKWGRPWAKYPETSMYGS
eukprot:1145213-Pelagomonas_calceolata.AAC.4